MPDDIPAGNCTFCDSPITEIQCVSHWRNTDHTGGFGYSGICRKCDIDFTIRYHDGAYYGWRPVAPHPEELTSIVDEASLERVSRKLQRYPAHHSQWQAFLARRREGDEVWRVGHGFAVVRGGRPISSFASIAPL